jgi:ferredoxin-NADP reductase
LTSTLPTQVGSSERDAVTVKAGLTKTGRRGSILHRGLSFLDALTTPHGIDRYIELVDPLLAVREVRGRVTKVVRSTPDTVTLTVRTSVAFKGFEAGQFVLVSVLIDGVRRTRPYSPANSQHSDDGLIELTIKADPKGIVSPYLVANAKPGMVLGLSVADGKFMMPSARPSKMLLISGGSGITPVLSMLRTLLDEGYDGEIVFLHYAYTKADVPCRDELVRLAATASNVRLIFGYTETKDGDLAGFFSDKHLKEAASWHREAHTYLCGPAGLMKAVREHYSEIGLLEQLFVEEFAPTVTITPGEATGAITFAQSRVATPNSGEVILTQAENAGLHPEYGCRMGICFSCTQIKKSGCVRNVISGEISDNPDEQIQLCISVPLSDVTIDI